MAAIPPGSINPPHGPASSCDALLAGFPINSSNDWNKTITEATGDLQHRPILNMVYARYSQGSAAAGSSNRGNDPEFPVVLAGDGRCLRDRFEE